MMHRANVFFDKIHSFNVCTKVLKKFLSEKSQLTHVLYFLHTVRRCSKSISLSKVPFNCIEGGTRSKLMYGALGFFFETDSGRLVL